ncbi:hypothetical protein ACIPY0_14995 [Paenarthrobacter nicotinovorans]|uniref:hypothetical protein n=1 Tax=Paenarthrobacter nicotinovorans TaxID=29320 RepID=UPI0037FE2C72
MPANAYRSPIPEELWDRIRDEFGLPALEQVRERLATRFPNPEPVIRQLFRVFLSDQGTYCPGFQFQPDVSLNPVVTGLFERAMKLRIPHNYIALWMMSPCTALDGSRPVDRLQPANAPALQTALETTLARAGA